MTSAMPSSVTLSVVLPVTAGQSVLFPGQDLSSFLLQAQAKICTDLLSTRRHLNPGTSVSGPGKIGASMRSTKEGVVAVPAACGKKILTIFAPYTFSHNQGHEEASWSPRPHDRSPSHN